MSQLRVPMLRPEYRLLCQDPQQQGERPAGEQDTSFVERNQAAEGQPGQQAEGTPGGARPPGPMCGTDTIIMIVAMVAIFYFLLIRPQQKQEKERRAMLAAIKEGDRVVTSGGIHGTISNLGESTVGLRIDPKVKITVDRQNIARIDRGDPPPADKTGS